MPRRADAPLSFGARRASLGFGAGSALLLMGCGAAAEADKATAWTPIAGETTVVVPGPGLPDGLDLLPANNNLDVVEHEGALFLAWRNAPNHFASEETRLLVVRSDDGGATWALEHSIHLGTDLREPRFLSTDAGLVLYYAILGTSSIDFEPGGAERSLRAADGTWSEGVPAFADAAPGIGGDTFIPWRARWLGDAAMMIGYTGGGVLYDFESGEGATTVQWLGSEDGARWQPWAGADPIVLAGGASETDLAVDGEGRVVAISRNEAGDAEGFGSKVCVAEPEAPMDWRCVNDPRRYDSPLVFAHEGEIWLVGRRNLNDQDGAFDLGQDELSPEQQSLAYSADYWGWPKRCALWRVDADRLAVDFVLDLDSRGDTCFPSVRWLGPHTAELWSYSSPLDGPDLPWLQAQVGPTVITRQIITFEPR